MTRRLKFRVAGRLNFEAIEVENYSEYEVQGGRKVEFEVEVEADVLSRNSKVSSIR